ncbi:hypothetical protein [Gallaecimonas sp. GXIMD4217]|uniref:DUF7281 domain-containing protein n=1 Tax=Gallaecimonas sp. GXIMD4217 TaxID=3131927 RepID=UPI00311B1E97
MAGLGRKHLKAIHELLFDHKDLVTATATWREIIAHFELEPGQEGKRLVFDARQRQLLRELASRHFGFDPKAPLPTGDRQAYADHGSIDEKLAPQGPDRHHVLVKGALPGLPPLPPEASLRLPLSSLALDRIARVLVIENLDTFDLWRPGLGPDGLADALVLYRGHRGLAAGSKRLLQELPATGQVIVFTDLDPAGLRIAHTLPRADALLVPGLTEELLPMNNAAHFHRQHQASRYLDRADLEGWQGLWQEIKTGQLSIKQQHMLARSAELVLVKR